MSVRLRYKYCASIKNLTTYSNLGKIEDERVESRREISDVRVTGRGGGGTWRNSERRFIESGCCCALNERTRREQKRTARALGSFEDPVCVLRFVKPSYESYVTGLRHELLDVRRIMRFRSDGATTPAPRSRLAFFVARFFFFRNFHRRGYVGRDTTSSRFLDRFFFFGNRDYSESFAFARCEIQSHRMFPSCARPRSDRDCRRVFPKLCSRTFT